MHLATLLISVVLFNAIDLSTLAEQHWDYSGIGPDVWEDLFPACSSTSQSPINIKSACTTYQSFPAFQFSPASNLTQEFRLTNNGHTIVGEQVNATGFPLTLSGGGLNETFTFGNFHLHWGENYKSGSEHQLNGQKFSGEAHFVYTNAARTQNAVLGFFMQATPSATLVAEGANGTRTDEQMPRIDNLTMAEWESFFAVGDSLNETNETTMISLQLLPLLATNLSNFYRYSGSLTTPPCTENVIWTVFQQPINFMQPVFDGLRAQVFFEGYRGPQPIRGRAVYRSFVNDTPSSISDYNCCGKSMEPELTTKAFNEPPNGNSILSITKQLIMYSFLFLIFAFTFLI